MKNFKKYLKEKHYSQSTIRIYENGISDFLKWISLHQYSIENVRYADRMSFIKHRQKKGVTKYRIQNELLSIRHYFNHLVKSR
jgi:site-specific recombinase XerD